MGFYEYGFPVDSPPSQAIDMSIVWGIVSIVLAIFGGIVIYFWFVREKDRTINKYLIWFKQFLDFKKMFIEDLLKIMYIMLSIYVTLISFRSIADNFFRFLFILVGGNIVLRLIFEGLLIIVMIWKNTADLNKKIKK